MQTLTNIANALLASCRVDSPADAVTAFEYDDFDAVTLEHGGTSQAADARSNDDDFLLLLLLRSWDAS